MQSIQKTKFEEENTGLDNTTSYRYNVNHC